VQDLLHLFVAARNCGHGNQLGLGRLGNHLKRRSCQGSCVGRLRAASVRDSREASLISLATALQPCVSVASAQRPNNGGLLRASKTRRLLFPPSVSGGGRRGLLLSPRRPLPRKAARKPVGGFFSPSRTRSSRHDGLDPCRLADALVAADVALFNIDGVPALLEDDGKLTRINRVVLGELIARFVVTPRLVFAANGELTVRFEPYAISEMEVRALLAGKSAQEGGLQFRLPSLQMPPPPAAQPAPTEDAAAPALATG